MAGMGVNKTFLPVTGRGIARVASGGGAQAG